MAGIGRVSNAIVLALAFVTAPLAFDQCAASCELAHLMSATAAAEPACHRASSTPHIGERRGACAHDHAAAPAAVTNAAPVALATANLLSFIAPAPAMADVRVVLDIERLVGSPPSSPLSSQPSLSLRI
jgi:hypothetical protein